MTKLDEIYLVLKRDDINKLPEYMISDLKSVMSRIEENRKKEGKIPMIKLIDVTCYS